MYTENKNIILLIGGAALLYYLYNSNNPPKIPPIVTPGLTPNIVALNNPITTINDLINKATSPNINTPLPNTTPTTPLNTTPLLVKTKTGDTLNAIPIGNGVNGTIVNAIIDTIAGPLPVTATANFISTNKTTTVQNLALTQNLVATSNTLENTVNTGPTTTQLTTKPIANNLVTIQKEYLWATKH